VGQSKKSFFSKANRTASGILVAIDQIELVEEDTIPLRRVTEHLGVVHHFVIDLVVGVIPIEALLIRRDRGAVVD
jgi:hypothetical protein